MIQTYIEARKPSRLW